MSKSEAIAWEIPSLWMPFDALPNKETLAMADRVTAWLRSTGLCPDPKQAALMGMVGASGTAYTLPAATGDYAETFSRYMSWGFYVDDLYDSAGDSDASVLGLLRQGVRLVEIVETPRAITEHDDAVIRAWGDIAVGLHRLASGAQLRRTIDAFLLTIFGWLRQAALAHSGKLPSLAGFMPFRWSSSAAGVLESMIELPIVRDPDSAAELLSCREACELAVIIGMLDNELLSRNKELVRGEYETGLVRVLESEYPALDSQGAMDTAITLRNRLMTVFVELRSRLLAEGGPEARIYMQALANYLAGIVAWTSMSDRYTLGVAPTVRRQPDREAWLPPLPLWITRWEQRIS